MMKNFRKNRGGEGRDFGSSNQGGGFRSNSGGGGFRNNDRGGSRGRFSSGPKEMHKAKCADCGKECEVPFKPTEGRPVYCNECFSKHRPPRFG